MLLRLWPNEPLWILHESQPQRLKVIQVGFQQEEYPGWPSVTVSVG